MTSKNRFIHDTAVIGCGPRFLQGAVPWKLADQNANVVLPESIYVGPFAIIGVGAKLKEGVVIDAYCRVEPLAEMGEDSLLLYRGTVGFSAKIGKECVIGGSVSEGTIVGDKSRSFGKLIHTHADSTQPWDFRVDDEVSPIVHHDSFVGHDATVIGPVEIGPYSYVCAGATISRKVPPRHIAYGCNQILHYTKWKGELKNNPLFTLGI